MRKERDLSKVKFPGETFLNIDDPELDFDRAREAAQKRVHTYDTEPMLLAWYDRGDCRESPSEGCEEESGDPGWISYAKRRGGNLTVNVNHGQYIFIFRAEHGFTP